MKILVSWLREFVDVAVSPEELGERLSLCGFELASVERTHENAVLDFEITANRPDALSVLGLAREAATAYSLPLHRPTCKPIPPPVAGGGDVSVKLEAPDLCPRYAAAVVDVNLGPSPTWLADRLQAAGVRPINNVVDVTNYVLLELGQPMHAFDLAKLAGRQLRVRRARSGERLRTLDGAERALETDMLVIADDDKPQAIAGVMGGALSEVSAGTTTVVLESACFNPKTVRLTSKRLGLKTEASARFERGTDIDAPVAGLERACALIESIGAGRVRDSLVDLYPEPVQPKPLNLRRARIARLLGDAVPDNDVTRILSGLEFAPVEDDDGWRVTVPTFRVDVSREVDLIEEVGRHHGYERLPATFPALLTPSGPPDPRIGRDRLVRRVLLAAGCSESVTFTFIDAAIAAHFADSSLIVPIANPLSAQFSVLRPSLLPGLLASITHNRHRERPDVRLFEVGATVTRTGESRRAAVAWIGDATASHWSSGRRAVDFFDVKGLVQGIGEALQVELSFDSTALPHFLVRGRAAAVVSGGQPVGVLGMLLLPVATAAGLPANEDVYVAELDLDALSAARAAAPLTVTPLPRHPAIARDISIIVDDILPAATVRGTIRSVAPGTLESVREFDRYQGKGVPDGRVSLSLRLTFRSADRTLTDTEVQKAMDTIVLTLGKEHQAIQR